LYTNLGCCHSNLSGALTFRGWLAGWLAMLLAAIAAGRSSAAHHLWAEEVRHVAVIAQGGVPDVEHGSHGGLTSTQQRKQQQGGIDTTASVQLQLIPCVL
jgi:hypothetical protein